MTRLGWTALALMLAAVGVSSYQAYATSQPSRPTTSFVGTFPRNIPNITELIDRAGSTLVVLADFCAYGQYSAPAEFAAYKAALKAARQRDRDVDVELHIYDQITADRMTASQFNLAEPDKANAGFETERQTDRFKSFFAYHRAHGSPKTEPASVEEFADLMRREQAACIAELAGAGIRIYQDISSPLPLFVWVRDRDEAIFSVYNLGPSSREVSLNTTDKGLLNLLDDISKRR